MNKEKKPFEIKCYNDLAVKSMSEGNVLLMVIGHYIDAANNEIRRLQAENRDIRESNIGAANFYDLKYRFSELQVAFEKQQAELKSEHDWTPITSVEQVEGLAPGVYLFKKLFPLSDLDIVSAVKSTDLLIYSWAISFKDGSMHKIYPTYFTNKFASYRLIHAFEEPEKKYQFEKASWTAKDIAESDHISCSSVTRELARDLLDKIAECEKKDARIRELEGK